LQAYIADIEIPWWYYKKMAKEKYQKLLNLVNMSKAPIIDDVVFIITLSILVFLQPGR
jgi:hypothetical protein